MQKMTTPLDPCEVSRIFWSLPFEKRQYRVVSERMFPDATPDELTKYDSQIGKLVRQWDLEKKVHHLVVEEALQSRYLPLLPDLEDQIVRRFGLRDVVVVDTTRLRTPSGNPTDNDEEWRRHNDLIHMHLGMWAGRIATTLIRAKDVVGTSGGRALYYTAASCHIPPSSSYFPERVVSLTGQISNRMWQQTNFESIVPPSLDADSIASLLKSALGTTAAPRYVNGPITQPNKRVNVSDVTVALIGIGALAGEHRLLRFEGFSELDSVQKELFALRKLVTDTDPPAEGPGPFHHWVGDVCNSLFVVDRALDGSTLKPAIALRLKGLVQKLNEKMVLTTPTKLAQICQKGVVLAIAGGRHKAAAVAHVLAQRPPWITHLVIDEHVGRHLLQSRAS